MSHEAAAAFAGTLDGKSGKSLTKYLPDTLSCRSDIEVGDSITADVAIIFARGTTEKGNIGISVGPPFSAAIAARLPSLKIAFQGVNYPAEFADMIQWGAVGADTMAELVRTALRANPRIHIVLSGYSQGALVARATTELLTETERDSVKCLVLFGDPAFGDEISNYPTTRVNEICHLEDGICRGNSGRDEDYTIEGTLRAHSTYRDNVGDAADFIANSLGA